MTVAAVILSATAEGALADTLGQPRVRRLVDIAWSGGALPVVVVSPDAGGAVAAALIGSEAVYGTPATLDGGPAGQMVCGAELALAEVRETSAILLWPVSMIWVGPETVTSLIEAHGVSPAMLLPAWNGQTGWPVLLPITALDRLRAMSSDLLPPAIVEGLGTTITAHTIDVGDPGVVHDAGTSFADLPPYDGPPDPPAGHTHEWGDGIEDEGVDERVPGKGRGLAIKPQAAADGPTDRD